MDDIQGYELSMNLCTPLELDGIGMYWMVWWFFWSPWLVHGMVWMFMAVYHVRTWQWLHRSHLLLLLLHRILRSTTDLARDGINLPHPGLPADVHQGYHSRLQFHFESFVFQKTIKISQLSNQHVFCRRKSPQPLLWWRLAFPPLCSAEQWQLTALQEMVIWRVPKVGIPLVIIHFERWDFWIFPFTKTIQVWGYSHDELETPRFCLWLYLNKESAGQPSEVWSQTNPNRDRPGFLGGVFSISPFKDGFHHVKPPFFEISGWFKAQ